MASAPRRPEQTRSNRVSGPAQAPRYAVPAYAQRAPILPPDEPVPGAIEPWEAVAAVRPDTPHVRALRFLSTTGDLLAAIVLIGGGMSLIGFASHF